MTVVMRLIGFGIKDLVRNRWTIVYALFFIFAGEGLIRMTADPSKALASLLYIVLFIVPLVGLLFGTMYIYGSREFIKLLLAQPLRRTTVLLGQYLSLSLSLCLGLLIGLFLPLVWHKWPNEDTIFAYLTLLAVGLFLTFIFVGIAFLISTSIRDKGKGVAMALFAWLLTAVLYDGVILLLAHVFSDYPLEKPLIIATLLNPIDLARVLLLIRLDYSALMGYTGAVFERFFGDSTGVIISIICLIVWTALPIFLSARRFSKKNL